MELKKYKVKITSTSTTEATCLIDGNNNWQGESIVVDYVKEIVTHGFFRDDKRIGKTTKIDITSGDIILQIYYPLRPGIFSGYIFEKEYKRDLVLYRLGEFECPHLNYLLKDYKFETEGWKIKI